MMPVSPAAAADVLERLTRERPESAQRWKEPLLGLLAEATEKKVRWNLALLIPRLKLTVPECRRVAELLQSWLDDPSSIVKTSALHGMADLTRQARELLPDVQDLLAGEGEIRHPGNARAEPDSAESARKQRAEAPKPQLDSYV